MQFEWGKQHANWLGTKLLVGTYLDTDDVSSMSSKQFADGNEYYVYEVNAPYAKDGAHCLAALTIKVRTIIHVCA